VNYHATITQPDFAQAPPFIFDAAAQPINYRDKFADNYRFIPFGPFR
jgi:hypothetical protein